MKKVYVHFKPIMVEVPDNVIEALSLKRHCELGKQVAGNLAINVIGGLHGFVDLKHVEKVVPLDRERFSQ